MKQGEVLMKERERKKLSPEELAERQAMPVDQYLAIEAGESPAEKWGPLIRELAVALGVPTSRMFATTCKWTDTRPGQAGGLIRQHREAKGISAETVAEKLGIPLEEHREIESGDQEAARKASRRLIRPGGSSGWKLSRSRSASPSPTGEGAMA